MFGWFKPICPVDLATKSWIEMRLRWLSDEFPDSAFSMGPIILPTKQYFPDPFDGSDRAIGALLYRVCQYMEVDPDRVDLEIFSIRETSSS